MSYSTEQIGSLDKNADHAGLPPTHFAYKVDYSDSTRHSQLSTFVDVSNRNTYWNIPRTIAVSKQKTCIFDVEISSTSSLYTDE